LVAAVPSGPNWTPPPTIPIKKILSSNLGSETGYPDSGFSWFS
jgi:hypothetical protein